MICGYEPYAGMIMKFAPEHGYRPFGIQKTPRCNRPQSTDEIGLYGADLSFQKGYTGCDLAGFSPNYEACSPCVAEENGCSVRIGAGVVGCGCGQATEHT